MRQDFTDAANGTSQENARILDLSDSTVQIPKDQQRTFKKEFIKLNQFGPIQNIFSSSSDRDFIVQAKQKNAYLYIPQKTMKAELIILDHPVDHIVYSNDKLVVSYIGKRTI